MQPVALALMGAVIFPGYMLLTGTGRKKKKVNLPSFPSLGGAPSPGAITPAVSPLVQAVALGMIGVAFTGAIVVMVVDYIHNGDATLPTAVGAIIFFGLGFITHALGSAQGAATTQSTVQSTANALSATPAPTTPRKAV